MMMMNKTSLQGWSEIEGAWSIFTAVFIFWYTHKIAITWLFSRAHLQSVLSGNTNPFNVGFGRFHHNNKSKGFLSFPACFFQEFTTASCQIRQSVHTSNIIMLVKGHPVKSGAQFRRLPQEGAGPLPALPSYYGRAELSQHKGRAGRVPLWIPNSNNMAVSSVAF